MTTSKTTISIPLMACISLEFRRLCEFNRFFLSVWSVFKKLSIRRPRFHVSVPRRNQHGFQVGRQLGPVTNLVFCYRQSSSECFFADAISSSCFSVDGDLSQGIQTVFQSGDSNGGCTANRQVTIQLVCGVVSNNIQMVIPFDFSSIFFGQTSNAFVQVSQLQKCKFVGVLSSPALCGATASPSPALSDGWIFVIVVLLTLTVYCAVGIVYKRQRLGITVRACVHASPVHDRGFN